MVKIKSLLNHIRIAYNDHRGWHTENKYIVFESDDWGAIRMPSKEVLQILDSMGYKSSGNKYEANDGLESAEDVLRLMEVLTKYSDGLGHHPVFTLNYVMANPDFNKIAASNYESYFYEKVSETYKRYDGDDKVQSVIEEGMADGFFRPQFHAREHFNVALWMEALRNNIHDMRKIASLEAVATNIPSMGGNYFVKAYDVRNKKEQAFIKTSITDGLKLFEDRFGFKSITAIAPNYLWDDDLEPTFYDCGVRMLQGGRVQNYSFYKGNKKRYNVLGNSRNGLIFSIRNSSFEPYAYGDEAVSKCLSDIEVSFRRGLPSIISTHRVNYVSRINNSSLTNLKRLSCLLAEIIKQYPDVIFVSSDVMYENMKDTL